MANRFGASSLHQRDPRSALFENYNGGAGLRDGNRNGSANSSPAPRGYGYTGGGVGGYSGGGGGGYDGGYGEREDRSGSAGGFRSATPNSRGQYSDAVLNELESQNNDQVEGIMGKVRQLKSMTIAIGDEIRESSALAEKMNDNFEGARVRIRGTMNRMLIMSQKTGGDWEGQRGTGKWKGDWEGKWEREDAEREEREKEWEEREKEWEEREKEWEEREKEWEGVV